MTREEIINLMPPPRTDWGKLEVDDIVLVVPTMSSGEEFFHWAICRIIRHGFGDTRWSKVVTNVESSDVPLDLDEGYDECYWNITEMSKNHMLPPEIAAFIAQNISRIGS